MLLDSFIEFLHLGEGIVSENVAILPLLRLYPVCSSVYYIYCNVHIYSITIYLCSGCFLEFLRLV